MLSSYRGHNGELRRWGRLVAFRCGFRADCKAFKQARQKFRAILVGAFFSHANNRGHSETSTCNIAAVERPTLHKSRTFYIPEVKHSHGWPSQLFITRLLRMRAPCRTKSAKTLLHCCGIVIVTRQAEDEASAGPRPRILIYHLSQLLHSTRESTRWVARDVPHQMGVYAVCFLAWWEREIEKIVLSVGLHGDKQL